MVDSKLTANIVNGQLVRSISGRDKGNYYLVWQISDDQKTVSLVDGRKRNLLHPKRKNLCHLQVVHQVAQGFDDASHQPIRDEYIRACLFQLLSNEKVIDKEVDKNV